MREINSEILISAPAEKVWSVITDFNKWKTWNPVVKRVSGEATLGAKLKVTMKGKDGKNGATYEPVLTDLNAPRYLRWRAKMIANFLFTNDKIFELKELNGKTYLVQKEIFSGLLVPLFWKRMERWVPGMLDSMNKALKKNVESVGSTREEFNSTFKS